MTVQTGADVFGIDETGGFYEKYEPKDKLGSGVSSVVRRCINNETGEEFAVKIIDKFSEASEAGRNWKGVDVISFVEAEINTLSKVAGHPNIIKLVDVFESSAFYFLVFELANGGELFDYMTEVVTIPEREARRFIWQIIDAVAFMHGRNIVHRDIKPENILLDADKKIMISDFGFAVELQEDETRRELCGTPGYLAPEVLSCSMYDDAPGYGKQVDVWACGVILYTLLVGFSPFWHRRQIVMIRNIMEAKYKFGSPEWDGISNAPKDLIRKLLVVDPDMRITAEQALAHPWFEGMHGTTKRKKRRHHFKAVVVAILTMKELYYTYHLRHQPMSRSEVIADPYGYQPIRKLIDGCAFKVYSHWVKRGNTQVQNRDALFQNSPKVDMKEGGLTGQTLKQCFEYSTPWSLRSRSSFASMRGSVSSFSSLEKN